MMLTKNNVLLIKFNRELMDNVSDMCNMVTELIKEKKL